MSIFSQLEIHQYEQLVFCHDAESGLKAVIAVHDTTLGPALGGIRMWPYSSEEDGIQDVLRLARGMTYKAAMAGLNLGGGKAVIFGDPRTDKSEALFRALGRYIEGLNGRYICAEDVGTTEEDMDWIHEETRYVTGTSPSFGSGGNPSPATAYGVYQGMKAAAKEKLGSESLAGMRIAIQGVGSVAWHLCEYLQKEKARLIVTDIQEDNVRKAVEAFGAESVHPEAIYDVEAEIFSPCALGAVINDQTLERLRCQIIAGSANNQLQKSRHGDVIEGLGILYVPDYVINAGGLIHVADELYGYHRERVMRRVERIYDHVRSVIQLAAQEQIPTYQAADRFAEKRIASLAKKRNLFLPRERHSLNF